MKESSGKLGIKRKVSTADQIVGGISHINLLDLHPSDLLDKQWTINDSKGNNQG